MFHLTHFPYSNQVVSFIRKRCVKTGADRLLQAHPQILLLNT